MPQNCFQGIVDLEKIKSDAENSGIQIYGCFIQASQWVPLKVHKLSAWAQSH